MTINNVHPRVSLQALPEELLELILHYTCKISAKNNVLEQRRVCKAFDRSLRKHVLRTVQIDVSRLMTLRDGEAFGLRTLGKECVGVHVNMTGTTERDVELLAERFSVSKPAYQVEADRLLHMLRNTCLGEHTMDARTFGRRLQAVLALLPHVTRAKLSLPCSIDTAPDFHTVQVLATTFDALAKRDEEYDMLESVVIKNLNTVALVQLCHNHMDLRNVQRVFEGVKNLVIDPTFRSHELDLQNPVDRYVQSFVFLAKNLETLCISTNSPYRDDDMRTWESVATPPRLPHLRCLELRGISFYASDFLNLCQECAGTLKEIYLLDVKLRTDLGGNPFDLWIGNPNKPHLSTALWIAPSMAAVENLCLVTLRATRLSYTIPGVTPAHRKWSDMADEPNNAFDERFVAIAMREQQLSQTVSISTGIAYSHDTNRSETDAVAFPRDMRKSSVNLQHGIDDIFADRSIAVTQVLGELLDLIEKAVEDVNKEIEHTLASDSFV